jgi:phage gp36-like protein
MPRKPKQPKQTQKPQKPQTANDMLSEVEAILQSILNDPEARDADKIAASTALVRIRAARDEGLLGRYELVLKTM